MCSTWQSPRAKNAFSRACAARTCPAPEVADSSKTRDWFFIGEGIPYSRMASRSLALAAGEFFQNAPANLLQFAEAPQVFLEIVVQPLRVLRIEFSSQNHVAEFHGMREQRIFLQFFQCGLGVVVIHGFPQRQNTWEILYSLRVAREKQTKRWTF